MSAPDLSASLTAMDWLPRLSAGGPINNITQQYVLDAPKVRDCFRVLILPRTMIYVTGLII